MEDPIIEVPHIRFILGDRPLILEDYVRLPQIFLKKLKHPFAQACIQSGSRWQTKQSLKSTWDNKLSSLSQREDYEGQ